MYLVFMGTKGGIGKSTLAKATMKRLAQHGKVVQFQDTDPQQHLTKFAGVSEQNGDCMVMDTQGAWTENNNKILTHFQTSPDDVKIIVPVQPSEDDVEEAIKMWKKFTTYQLRHKVLFVMNRAKANDPDVKHFKKVLQDNLLNVARTNIRDLKAYRNVTLKGCLGEMDALLTEVGAL